MAMTVFLVLGGVFVLEEILFKTIDIYIPPAPNIRIHQNTIDIFDKMTSAITKVLHRAKQGLNQAYHACEPGPSSRRRVKTRGTRYRAMKNAMFGYAMMHSGARAHKMTPNNEAERQTAYASEPVSIPWVESQVGFSLDPNVWAQNAGMFLAKRRMKNTYPPWDPHVAPFVYTEGVRPPCDTEAFFGGNAKVEPPEQEPSYEPYLEDPIYEESPFYYDSDNDLMCFTSTISRGKAKSPMVFDTDSGEVGIDNRCSACMSPHKDDFVGDLIEMNKWIKGYGGKKL